MNLTATDTSSHSEPAPVAGGECYQLPFFSLYHTAGTAGVDVLSQHIRKLPGTAQECFGFCFSPPSMVDVVLSRIDRLFWFRTLSTYGPLL